VGLCCALRGARYAWDPIAACKTTSASVAGTVSCFENAASCEHDAGETCLKTGTGGATEVLILVDRWTPAELGEKWGPCPAGLADAVQAAPECP
jgi:hypothetical protein